MKSKSILVVVCISLAFSCKDDDEKKGMSKEEMLTANSSKAWILAEANTDATEEHEVCKSTSDRNLDNTWTFFKGGDFEFNNGTVIEDPACDVEGCCSDFVNLHGTWRFSTNEENLIVEAIGEIGSGGEKTPFPVDEQGELFNAKINKLTVSELSVSQGDYTAKFTPED